MRSFTIEENKSLYSAKIKVVGVGGGGGNMINHIIRENPNNSGNYQILVTSHNLKFMDVSLGSLIWYITDNEDCLEISEQGRDLLNRLLLDYKDSVRNGYFHKHNLEDIEEVKRIRENTLYLLCLFS